MACSVGGSGGQISVSSGGAGAEEEAGGHVDFIASAATALGGSLKVFTVGGSLSLLALSLAALWVAADSASASACGFAAGSASSVPGDVGTVWAHAGAFFGLSPLAEASVFDQSGSPFFCAGAAGELCAQTGVVSLVGTGCTGSSTVLSGGVDSSGAGGLVSKSQSV